MISSQFSRIRSSAHRRILPRSGFSQASWYMSLNQRLPHLVWPPDNIVSSPNLLQCFCLINKQKPCQIQNTLKPLNPFHLSQMFETFLTDCCICFLMFQTVFMFQIFPVSVFHFVAFLFSCLFQGTKGRGCGSVPICPFRSSSPVLIGFLMHQPCFHVYWIPLAAMKSFS